MKGGEAIAEGKEKKSEHREKPLRSETLWKEKRTP